MWGETGVLGGTWCGQSDVKAEGRSQVALGTGPGSSSGEEKLWRPQSGAGEHLQAEVVSEAGLSGDLTLLVLLVSWGTSARRSAQRRSQGQG